MNLPILVIDVLGILCFLIATFYAYKNHEKMKDASNLWLYFGTSSLMATLWILSFIIQQFMGIPDIIESTFFFAVVFLFSLVAMASLFDFVKLQGRLGQ